MRRIIALFAFAFLAVPAMADGTLDGVIGAGYGAAVVADPNPGTVGGAVCNITNLYVYEAPSDIFIAINVEADVTQGGNDWGKYMFFIETDNATNRAGAGNGNGWNRPINADGVNCRPTYWIGSWVNSGAGTEIYTWNGSGWGGSSPGITQARGGGTPSVVEYQIPKALLGNPQKIKVWAMSSGGGGGDSAIDTVPTPTAGEVADWGNAASIDSASPEVTVPVELSTFVTE